MITIKVVAGTGENRVFRFAAREIRVGFRLGAEISLEPLAPNAPEIRILESAPSRYIAEPVGLPGAFQLNGAAIAGSVAISAGDVITANTHKVVIEEIAVAGHPSGGGEVCSVSPVPGTGESSSRGAVGGYEAAAGKPVANAAESYLVLFFAPIREYLEDDDVSEIMINGPSSIYIERRGKVTLTDAKFLNEQALQAAVKNVARNIGRHFNLENPRLDARLPDGSRVHAVMPPLARCGTVVAIRKFRKDKLTMDQLVKFGSISPHGAGLIEAIVKLHKNVIVSGPTSSGKTSVLNVLSSFIQRNERVIVIEDASELQLQQEHVVPFETRKPDEHGKGEVSIRDLVVSSLRLRPDRLIIGEIRSGEALDMLQAMNTGHSGSMSTIHANSPVDCLSRIETCALLSGLSIPLQAIRSQVASAINVVVHTARLSDGSRRITNVSEVMPLKNGEYAVQDLICFRAEGVDAEGRMVGRFSGSGVKPTFYDEAILRGIAMKEEWFESAGK
ncbi:MAG: CpaF family protein [bacterium]